MFNTFQISKLKEAFNRDSTPSLNGIQGLACKLDLTEEQVKTWFRNRRVQQGKGEDSSESISNEESEEMSSNNDVNCGVKTKQRKCESNRNILYPR